MIHGQATPISEQIDQVRLDLHSAPPCLERGDIIFGYRDSAVQRVMNIWGDPMTHVGVIATVGGVLRTIELGPDGLFSRSLDQFSNSYRQLGIVRPAIPGCKLDELAATAEQHLLSQDLNYAWSICALVQVSAFLRRYVPPLSDGLLGDYSHSAAALLTSHIGPRSHTCSSFVAACLASVYPTTPESLGWPVRARACPWQRYPSITDLERNEPAQSSTADARWSRLLLTPADLFVGTPADYRVIVRNGRTIVLIDSDAEDLHRRSLHSTERTSSDH